MTSSGPSMTSGGTGLPRPAGFARGAPSISAASPPESASLAAGLVSLVTRNCRRASNSASRIWRTFTLQAMATTTAASPTVPIASQAATAGWLAPAARAVIAAMQLLKHIIELLGIPFE